MHFCLFLAAMQPKKRTTPDSTMVKQMPLLRAFRPSKEAYLYSFCIKYSGSGLASGLSNLSAGNFVSHVSSPGERCFGATPPYLEQTVAAQIEFTGVGLHSGAPVTMCLCQLLPARASSFAALIWTILRSQLSAATSPKSATPPALCIEGVLISPPRRSAFRPDRHGHRQRHCRIGRPELPILDGKPLPDAKKPFTM